MQSLIGMGVRLLEGLFVLGAIGSTVVLLKVLIEDVEILFGGAAEPER